MKKEIIHALAILILTASLVVFFWGMFTDSNRILLAAFGGAALGVGMAVWSVLARWFAK